MRKFYKSKTIWVGAVVVIIAVLALAPIAIYGDEVDVAQISFDISVDDVGSTARLADLQPSQIPSYIVGISNAKVDVISMSPHEYIIARSSGRTQVGGEENGDGAIVDITITFELVTPSNKTLTFVITPGNDQGIGGRDVIILLGPEDGVLEEGEYYLTMTITIKVTPPRFTEPVVDMVIDPVDLVFTIPVRG